MRRDWVEISRPLTADMPVWPGDDPFRLHTSLRDGWSVSHVDTTCHVGTHAETGLHVEQGHPPLSAIGLETFCGPAEVVHAACDGASAVSPRHLPGGWSPAAPRVLIRTGTFPVGSPKIGFDFAGLDPELIKLLAAAEVRLVGLDTPSVDPLESQDFPAHHALARLGLVWFEGLDLEHVDPGLYDLVALPLPLVGTEAAPARVVIRPLTG